MSHDSRLTTHDKHRPLKEIAFSVVALFLLMNLLQTPNILFYFRSFLLFKIGFLASIAVIGVWIFFSAWDFIHRRGIFYNCIQKFRSINIPKAAKFIIVFAFIGNLFAIAWGTQRYPFYDVGMFRWPVDFKASEKIKYEVKYYYWQEGRYKILELRKEASFFLSEHFGLGYSNDFAYATAYFHKSEKENFEFLSQAMKERGVDTLWVGVHSVNFETREVDFDPDICNAVKINRAVKLYYGSIYIPEYQLEKCEGQR
jgi:hypothetical protein